MVCQNRIHENNTANYLNTKLWPLYEVCQNMANKRKLQIIFPTTRDIDKYFTILMCNTSTLTGTHATYNIIIASKALYHNTQER